MEYHAIRTPPGLCLALIFWLMRTPGDLPSGTPMARFAEFQTCMHMKMLKKIGIRKPSRDLHTSQ